MYVYIYMLTYFYIFKCTHSCDDDGVDFLLSTDICLDEQTSVALWNDAQTILQRTYKMSYILDKWRTLEI